jgi:hypothetical protein
MNSRRDFVEQTVTVSAASLSGTIASAQAGSQPHPQPLWQRLSYVRFQALWSRFFLSDFDDESTCMKC